MSEEKKKLEEKKDPKLVEEKLEDKELSEDALEQVAGGTQNYISSLSNTRPTQAKRNDDPLKKKGDGA